VEQKDRRRIPIIRWFGVDDGNTRQGLLGERNSGWMGKEMKEDGKRDVGRRLLMGGGVGDVAGELEVSTRAC
jgi:hypothetical protein